MKISLIIPCYNEEEALTILYDSLIKVSRQMKGYSFQFLFVNDGSTDNTGNVLKNLSRKDERVNYISFSRNFGKEAAMYAGFCNADGDYVAVMDADMQDPPSLLPEMMEYIENGYDCVAAVRVFRRGERSIRSFFSGVFYKVINKISNVDIVEGARDFRIMKRNVADAVISVGEYTRFSKGIFEWVGFKTYWLPYEHVGRAAGRTKWSLCGLLKYSLDSVTSISQMPLYISLWMGIGFTVLSFVMMVCVIAAEFIFGVPVKGWLYLACLIIFMGGIQLFCIGIIGQYLAKTYLEVKKRPRYIIAESNMKNPCKSCK